jgi:hypothetical protein
VVDKWSILESNLGRASDWLTTSSWTILSSSTIPFVGEALVPLDMRLLAEDFLEGAKCGRQVAADGDNDIVAGEDRGARELAIEGVSFGLVVRLVDLQLM